MLSKLRELADALWDFVWDMLALLVFLALVVFFLGVLPFSIVYFIGFELGHGSLWAVLAGIAFAVVYFFALLGGSDGGR